MSAVTLAAPAKWDTREYRRMVSATYRDGKLVVLFEDGTWVDLKADRVMPPEARGAQWQHLSVSPYEITVPTDDGEVEIPWSTVRAITDKEYSAHLADAAEEEARQIGLRIRELRESRNLPSKELAERAGITPQSLSRIELGRHDVVFTTLQRILAAMGCSLKDLAGPPREPASVKPVLKKLAAVGIDREFAWSRLLPGKLRSQIGGEDDPEVARRLSEQLAASAGRVFGWSRTALFGDAALQLPSAWAQASRFKVQGRTNELRATAYTVYAHYLALLVLNATPVAEQQPVPSDPDVLREAVIARYGSLTFPHLLRYTWDLGVPVLPLRDPGAFHGACWRSEGRNVIVLKQVTDALARWLFDLGHELKHVASDLSDLRPSVIEGEEISPFVEGEDEWEASEFASRLILYGRAEELAKEAVRVAQGSVERLKSVVQRVAAAEHVPVDALANYIAFRLSMQGQNWWGAANNLQVNDPSPWQTARDCLLERVDLERLTRPDRELLLRALTDDEEV